MRLIKYTNNVGVVKLTTWFFLRLNVIYINFDDQLNNNKINENRLSTNIDETAAQCIIIILTMLVFINFPV